MKIAIYSRKSKITETGESIKNQIDLCKDYIALHICKEAEISIYEDEGFSGGNTDRPAYNRLLTDIKIGLIKTVVVYRLDRVSRNVLDFSKTLDVLNNYNVSFVSISEHFDTSTPMGRAMIYISSVFAQLERETIAERIRDNKYRLARTGHWLGGPAPFGFGIDKIEYSDDRGNKKKYAVLIPDCDKLKTVEFMFDEYVKHKSLTHVVYELAKAGIKTNRGVDFSERSVKIILKNPIYVKSNESIYNYFKELGCDIAGKEQNFRSNFGLTVFNKFKHTKRISVLKKPTEWIIAVSETEGIINPEKWLTAQSYINTEKTKPPRNGTGKLSPLTSFLVCSKCGKKMNANHKSSSNKTRHHYYRCRTKAASKGILCDTPNLQGKSTDEAVIRKLIEYIGIDKDAIIIALNKEQHLYIGSDSHKTLGDENAALKTQINNLTLQLSKQPDLSEYIMEQIKNLDFLIRSNQQKLKEYNSANQADVSDIFDIKKVLEIIMHPEKAAKSLTSTDKKMLLKSVVKAIYWDGEELKLELDYGQAYN